jgi:hypothetical protein
MEFLALFKSITYISPVVLILGLCIAISRYKQLNGIYRGVTFYLGLVLVVDIASRVMGIYGNNLILLSVYSLAEVIFFLLFYFKYLYKTSHKVQLAAGAVAIAYILWDIVTFEKDVKQFQSYAKVADNFIVILLALGFFHERIYKFKDVKWDNFSLNAAILIYFTINLIFFLPLNFLINEDSGLKFYFWSGNVAVVALFYIFLICSLWKNGRTQK